MIFDQIVGNDFAKKRLRKMLESGQVPHLLLFSGPESADKRLFAVEFAKEWLQQMSEKNLDLDSSFHPDLQLLRPEGKTGMLSIQSVRLVIETLHHSPFEAGGKAVVFDEAERMLPSSANALLKVLEEPPSRTLIILVSNRPEKLLETIRSRSQLIRFEPGKEVVSKSDELEEVLFTLLITFKDKNFAELSASCLEIQKMVEARKKEKEASLKEELPKTTKEMPAAMRELLESDIEGAVTLFWLQDVERLLYSIYAFYRDLVAVSAKHPSLHFTSKKEAIVQAYNQGRTVPLDRVDKLLQWAKQAVERYQPLQNVLETLLLQLT